MALRACLVPGQAPCHASLSKDHCLGTKRETHFAWQSHPAGHGNPCSCRRAKSALLRDQGHTWNMICFLSVMSQRWSSAWARNSEATKLSCYTKKGKKTKPCSSDWSKNQWSGSGTKITEIREDLCPATNIGVIISLQRDAREPVKHKGKLRPHRHWRLPESCCWAAGHACRNSHGQFFGPFHLGFDLVGGWRKGKGEKGRRTRLGTKHENISCHPLLS